VLSVDDGIVEWSNRRKFDSSWKLHSVLDEDDEDEEEDVFIPTKS